LEVWGGGVEKWISGKYILGYILTDISLMLMYI